MRFLSIACAAGLFCFASSQNVFADLQTQTTKPIVMANAATNGSGKEATSADNPATSSHDGAPKDGVKQALDKSLLPVRPKDFNPMLSPASSEDGLDAQQFLSGQNMSAVTQMSGYIAQLTYFTRCLVLIIGGGVFIFFIGLFYLRGILIQTGKSVEAARVGAQIAGQNILIAKETAEKQLRAYVFTNGARGELIKDKSDAYSVRVEVKNFGTTPAYSLSGWMTVFIDDSGTEREITSLQRDSEMVQTVLPPGGICFYYARTFHPVTRELKAIAAGQKAIYAYGEIRYKDVFNIEHYAKFRIKCAGERNLESGSFDHCLEGNEAN